jgi:hypothetical protein
VDSIKASDHSENPKIKKDTALLMNDRYKTPNTSMLIFHFEPHLFDYIEQKLRDSSIKHDLVEGKDIYIFDNFFSQNENQDLLTYSRNAKFSRHSYASSDSKEKGEDPASSMNNKEKWEFFAKPPQAVKELFKFLDTLSLKMDADITTLPWDLCDQKICASAVATNRIEKVSKESMEMGKHDDYNTEEGIPFGIPILYSEEKSYHPTKFVNGEEGRPWLITIMLYAAEDNFRPEYGMGTIFCKNNGEVSSRADSVHTRFVLFEGDIIHSIEESKIPDNISQPVWRISYVFKLLINPRKENQSMKNVFHQLINSYKKSGN